MRIAILGFGTVGKGVFEIIKENGLSDIDVVKILKPRSHNDLSMYADLKFTTFEDIINDESIDTIVECMGGITDAYNYVKTAIEKGKNVVTSNKMLVATYYDELIELSKRKGVYFLFEASVGGGVPWIENLMRVSFVDTISGYKGIINGTTNYILDKMTSEGLDFDIVLKEAQDLGYAEKDPSSDIDGDDVLYKNIISANVASRKSFDIKSVKKFGIRNIKKEDIDYFNENGYICKLIAEYDAKNNFLIVIPELFSKKYQIANVSKNYNHMDLYCKTEGTLSFEGQGAGKLPTAHSIIQDLFRIIQHAKVPILTTEKAISKYDSFKSKFYIRHNEKKEIVNEILFNDIDFENIDFIAKVND